MASDTANSALRPGRPAPWRDPRVRGIFLQLVFVAVLAAIVAFLVHNTVVNLGQRGIASGFGFLGSEASFGIGESLIEYSPADTYLRAFLVGLVNTLYVSAIGIVLATIVGTVMGLARLSSNWLVAKLAQIYVETFRNIPLALQLLFWWGLLRGAAPAPGAHRSAIPQRMARAGADRRPAARGFSRVRRAAGSRRSGAARFQLCRRHRLFARIRRAVDRSGHLYRQLHRRDRARRDSGGQLGPERGGFGARPHILAAHAPDRVAAGLARHRAADDQRVSESDQKQLARRDHRLSRSRFDRQHDDQPDRPCGRRDHDDHGGLSRDQPRHLAGDEPLQPRRRAGGALAVTDFTQDLPAPALRPPIASTGIIGWLRANLFNSVFNSVLTLIAVYILATTIPPIIRWALVDAVWSAPSGQACRGEGACWAFIAEKFRFILFGVYPYAQQWRPLFVVVIFIAMILASCDRRLWGRRLMVLWPSGLVVIGTLMWGGVFGLSYVGTESWSGLPLTLILAVIGMV